MSGLQVAIILLLVLSTVLHWIHAKELDDLAAAIKRLERK